MNENQKRVERVEFTVSDAAGALDAMRSKLAGLPNEAEVWERYVEAQTALNEAEEALSALYYALGEAEDAEV